MNVATRREEYTEATRRALVDAAADLFAEHGFAETSVEDVVRRARLTRGALYHHFPSKLHLFEVVYTEVEAQAAARITAAASGATNAWSAVTRGIDAFLDLCLDSRYRRLAIVEAPFALGARRHREIVLLHSLGLLRAALEALIAEGRVRRQDLELPARLLFSALGESALAIAEAPVPAAARVQAAALLRSMLAALG